VCGIVGIICKNNSTTVTPQIVTEMCDIISHRGPDDHGIFVNENVGLGHRRLSIIDLESGHQPMISRDQQHTIVYNGEIYNYKELKSRLQSSGSIFYTNSDTEVILELYRHYGKECVKLLNGIFAFCIYDKRSKEIYIARDHAGIKPLYYHNSNNHFIFSSEIKSILKSGLVDAECNTDRINEYFIFREIAGEETLFKNIISLPPGSYLLLQNGEVSITQYWEFTQTTIDNTINYPDALERLNDIFTDAIKLQLMSDVALGTFCSGGVDSSLVTAVAAINTGNNINTYSIGFDEKDYDESKYARIVSEKYKTNHHELRLNNIEFTSLLEKSIWHNDLPLNFPNSVLIYALSTLAKNSVTVVLTGEGADELFGGYPRYMIPIIQENFARIPPPFLNLAKYGLNLFSDHRARKLSSFMSMTDKEILLYNSAILSQNEINTYGLQKEPDAINYRNTLINATVGNNSALNRVSLLDQQTYLASILNRQDKMSMAASIESRVPILDYRLIEFANSLPDTLKCKRFKTKILFKKLAEKYLPHEVIYRRKSGFGVPLEKWFYSNEGLGKLADEILTESSLEELHWKGDIRKVISEHKSNVSNHAEFLWSALNYVQWKSVFNVSI